MRESIPDELADILSAAKELERSYLVGGCVRDWLLGHPQKDFDIEVFGVPYDRLVQVLRRWGRPDLVGRSFGVVKLTTPGGNTFDFTIPRRDSKVSSGHQGFEVTFDPDITLAAAASRRDFTINSLMWDPRAHHLLDFFGGEADLRRGVLRHTSPAFVEDPLRVLRGMQFAGRFRLEAAPETIQLSRSLKNNYHELARERVRDEWYKWASQSRRPSAGLRFLEATAWLEHFPEVAALAGTPQDPEWHPEGDVFVHTGHCCDALVELPEWLAADNDTRTVYSLAVLGHDFGKPATTAHALKDGQMRVISPGHEEAGGAIAESFLERIHMPLHIRERVLPLVTNHLAHLNEATDRSVRRLAKRLEPETIESLCVVMTADHFGRPPKPRIVHEGITALRAKATELKIQASAPRPILQGRHLLELGLVQSRALGVILSHAFEAQLEGKFFDLNGAKHWLLNDPGVELPDTARDALRTGLQRKAP